MNRCMLQMKATLYLMQRPYCTVHWQWLASLGTGLEYSNPASLICAVIGLVLKVSAAPFVTVMVPHNMFMSAAVRPVGTWQYCI
jgi:hypothetical protein